MKIFLVAFFALTLLTGCISDNKPLKDATVSTTETTEEPTEPVTIFETELFLFEEIAGEYAFSSGAGGWSTDIILNEVGIFEGDYHDSEAGTTGDDYPNGTVYICNFDGNFTEPEKIDEYTYSMKLEAIKQLEDEGVEYIEDGIKYIHSNPAGFEEADEFIVYLPGKPVSELPEEYLNWDIMAKDSDTLDHIGIYNVSGETGFVQLTN